MSWISVSMSFVFSMYRTSKHLCEDNKGVVHLLSERKSRGETSSTIDRQSSTGTMSCFVSSVSNST